MQLSFDPADLKPIVETVVDEVLARAETALARAGDRLGYTEPEAAALIGVEPHVLRDCRLRGELHARKVGKRYVYERSVLVKFLREKG